MQVLRELEKRGNRRRAYEVFEFLLMARATGELPGVPSTHNFVTVLSMLARDGRLATAASYLDKMRELEMRVGVHEYTALLAGR